ncbi:class I SAM-dependent methyltransferase [Acidocella aromatica]|uniref:Methyltransferase FkbM domain-containing protein n=1 Tax=Acidocella aromatica TaxID=1303579 RepID=A0A840VN62_9PROT|nr:hypothetical protein [Acidocella aromatica]MBB5371782.1 hypothetical protein [Acidocella aromatica]
MTHCTAWSAELPDLLEERFASAVAGKSGLVVVPVAQRPFPLWLRAGTGDADAATASFDPQMNGLKFVHEPRRVLEIGARAGYRSVALAHAYPGAEIIATEPNAAFQRVAVLNTVPYGNVTVLNLAIGTDNARHDFFGREGEAGYPALMRHEAGQITATPLAHLLNHRRWNDVDTIILTPDAASIGILDQPLPRRVRLLAVETGGATLPPETMAKLPMAEFLTMISGDYVLFYRRALQKVLPEPPRATPVYMPDGPLQRLTLENVSADPPGFFQVGREGFRLHPNPYGAPLARVTMTQRNLDFAELQVSMRVVREESASVRFKVEMLGETGTILASAMEVVPGGKARGVVLQLPEYRGPCSIAFSTQMAEHGASNHAAWAEFISATFV